MHFSSKIIFGGRSKSILIEYEICKKCTKTLHVKIHFISNRLFISALEISKHLKTIEEVKDLSEFLSIFSLGDELNREIIRFISQDFSEFFNTFHGDNTEEVFSESSNDSFDSDLSPGESEITDEYYDSDSN